MDANYILKRNAGFLLLKYQLICSVILRVRSQI